MNKNYTLINKLRLKIFQSFILEGFPSLVKGDRLKIDCNYASWVQIPLLPTKTKSHTNDFVSKEVNNYFFALIDVMLTYIACTDKFSVRFRGEGIKYFCFII